MDSDSGYERRFGFSERKYLDLLVEVYRQCPSYGPNDEPRTIAVPTRLVVDDEEQPALAAVDGVFELPVCKEYVNEPESRVGTIYLLQRSRYEGRIFSTWKNCGSKKVSSSAPSSLKIRYFQHKAPDLTHIRKRVITLTADNDEWWKLVHIIHKSPKESVAKRRRLPGPAHLPEPAMMSAGIPALHQPAGELVQLAALLHTEQAQDCLALTSLVPNRCPPNARVVVKVIGTDFTPNVQVVWGGNVMREEVIFRSATELWVEAPEGKSGSAVSVHVQEQLGETDIITSNTVTFNFDFLPEDEPLLKRVRALEERVAQVARGLNVSPPNATSQDMERWRTFVGSLDGLLDEAKALFKDISEHFSNQAPPAALACRIENIRQSVSALDARGTKRSHSTMTSTRPSRTTDEHNALLALQTLCGDLPITEGDATSNTATHAACQPGANCGSANPQDHVSGSSSPAPAAYTCQVCKATMQSREAWESHIACPEHVSSLAIADAIPAQPVATM